MRKFIPALLSLVLVWTLAGSALASASPLLAPAAPGTLAVTVLSEDASPVEGAQIHLLTPGQPAVTVARTDEKGQAAIALPGGFSFWIRVWADGYALLERPYVPASDGPALTLQVTPYTATLTGLVADDQGLPVAGAKVSLYREGYGLESTGTTNEMGLYSLRGLRADATYTQVIEAEGFQPLAQTVNGLNPDSRNQIDYDLTPAHGFVTGEVVNGRTRLPVSGAHVELLLEDWGVVQRAVTDGMGFFSLKAPPADGSYQVRIYRTDFETITSSPFTVSAGSWTDFSGQNRFTLNPLYARVSGKVVDASNKPVKEIEVHLQRLGLGTVEKTTTDAEGRFRFERVPAGTFRVRAFPKGDLVRQDTGWMEITGGKDVTTTITVDVPDTTSHGGSTSLTGIVLNHLGDPVEGATVTVHRGSQVKTVKTDEEGRYDVEVSGTVPTEPDEDPATGYHVSVKADGYLETDQPDVEEGALPPSLIAIRHKGDNQANFTLQPEKGSVAGRVVDQRGRGIAGVRVGLQQEGTIAVLATTETDEHGRYEFPGLPFAKQARYLPVVIDDEYVRAAVTSDGSQVEPASLEPASATSVTLVARPAAVQLQGLIQAGDDRPAEGATVTVRRSSDGSSFTATTAADGSYLLRVPAVPAEQYVVTAVMAETATALSPELLSFGSALGARINLTLHPTASIAGRVFDQAGRPRGGVKVLLFAEGSAEPVRIAYTTNDGDYRFTGLTPDRRYAVVASDQEGAVSGLAPGEPIITPLIPLPSGETRWADLTI